MNQTYLIKVVSTSNVIASQTHKVYADVESCGGYGVCNQLCPEIYKLNDDDIVYL